MSFDYNPYSHIEVIITDDGRFRPYCHSCGYEWQRHPGFSGNTFVGDLFEEVAAHVRKSHNRPPEWFTGWSTL